MTDTGEVTASSLLVRDYGNPVALFDDLIVLAGTNSGVFERGRLYRAIIIKRNKDWPFKIDIDLYRFTLI